MLNTVVFNNTHSLNNEFLVELRGRQKHKHTTSFLHQNDLEN